MKVSFLEKLQLPSGGLRVRWWAFWTTRAATKVSSNVRMSQGLLFFRRQIYVVMCGRKSIQHVSSKRCWIWMFLCGAFSSWFRTTSVLSAEGGTEVQGWRGNKWMIVFYLLKGKCMRKMRTDLRPFFHTKKVFLGRPGRNGLLLAQSESRILLFLKKSTKWRLFDAMESYVLLQTVPAGSYSQKLDSEACFSTLHTHLLPMAANTFGESQVWLFQQNESLVYRSVHRNN